MTSSKRAPQSFCLATMLMPRPRSLATHNYTAHAHYARPHGKLYKMAVDSSCPGPGCSAPLRVPITLTHVQYVEGKT